MATNNTLDIARAVNLVPTDPASGGLPNDPCQIGALPGVFVTKQLTAATGAFANNSAAIATSGVWNLSVKGVSSSGNSAVAIGDIIYYTSTDTPKLSKKDTGKPYGVALATVGSGSTASIDVALAVVTPGSGAVANGDLFFIPVSGNLTVAAGVLRYAIPKAAVLLGVSLTVNTAPLTTAIICDVNKNGTTIFTTSANRPQIAASANATASEVTNMDINTFAAGDYLTLDVAQIGTGTVGANLVATFRWQWA